MAIDIRSLIERLQQRGFSQELIRDITAASQQVIQAQENQFDSSNIAQVRSHFEAMNELLEQNRSTLQETLDVNAELQSNYSDEREILMDIIDEEIAAGDLSSDRLKSAQKRIKELAKLNKSIENYNAGMEKGEAAAKEILQATIGLSTEWSMLSSKSGIQGMGKGFVGSLKSLMSPMNLLMALAQKVFERAVAYDKASADLFKRTGLDKTQINLKNIATDLKGMSVELQSKAATSVADFQEGYRSFGELQKDQVELTTKTITVLNHFGASNAKTVETFGILTKTLGDTPELANKFLNDTTAMAEELGRPPSEILSDFTAAAPVLAIYGQESKRIFKNLATQATVLGMDVSKLATLTQDMDTFEGAAKAAQAFNVAMGAPFLSAQALLAADDVEKMDMIKEAYERATPEQKAQLTPRVLRGLAKDMNVSVEELVRVLNLDQSKYKSKVGKVQSASAMLSDNVKKVTENQTVMDKVTAQIQRIIDNIIQVTNADTGLSYAAGLLTKLVEAMTENRTGERDRRQSKKNLEDFKKSGETRLIGLGDNMNVRQSGFGGAFSSQMNRSQIYYSADQMRNMRSRLHSGAINFDDLDPGLQKFFAKTVKFESEKEGSFYGKTLSLTDEQFELILKQQQKLTGVDATMLRKGQSLLKTTEAQRAQGGFGSRSKQEGFVVTSSKNVQRNEDAMATPVSVKSNYVQPVFNKRDKFYAAKDGGAIANALDEVLAVVDKLIEQKQDVNLDINERKLAQAVDRAFVTLSTRRV